MTVSQSLSLSQSVSISISLSLFLSLSLSLPLSLLLPHPQLSPPSLPQTTYTGRREMESRYAYGLEKSITTEKRKKERMSEVAAGRISLSEKVGHVRERE